MIQDNSLTFAQAQAITATAEATNVIDTVVVNGGIQGSTGNTNNGDPEPLHLSLVVSTDQLFASADGSATLTISLYSGATDTATNTLYTSPALTIAQLNALAAGSNNPLANIVVPRGQLLEFLGLEFTVGTENFTAGHITAFLAFDAVQTNFNQ